MSHWTWSFLYLVGLLLIGGHANAEDERARRARAEVERELRELVRIPAPRISVELVPLPEANLKCRSIELLLDGRVLPLRHGADLDALQPVRLFRGEVGAGRHELIARVEYEDTSSVMFSEHAGVKWRVSSSARFDIQDGLEIALEIVPERAPEERDLRKAIRVNLQHGVKMVATVDTSMPPPLAPPPPPEQAKVPQAPVAAAQQTSRKNRVGQAEEQAPSSRQTDEPGMRTRKRRQATVARIVEASDHRDSMRGPASAARTAAEPKRTDDKRVPVVMQVPAHREDPVSELELTPLVGRVTDAGQPGAGDGAVRDVTPEQSTWMAPGAALAAGLLASLLLGVIVVVRRRR